MQQFSQFTKSLVHWCDWTLICTTPNCYSTGVTELPVHQAHPWYKGQCTELEATIELYICGWILWARLNSGTGNWRLCDHVIAFGRPCWSNCYTFLDPGYFPPTACYLSSEKRVFSPYITNVKHEGWDRNLRTFRREKIWHLPWMTMTMNMFWKR